MDENANPEDLGARRKEKGRVRLVLEKLEPDPLAILEYFMAGHSIRQIAHRLGVNQSTFR